MIGSEATKYDGYGLYTRAIDFPIKQAESLNISSNPNKEASDNIGVGRAMSFFGRINYSYQGKHLLTANIRRDGSDRFGPKNRWGTFPSVNGAWRLSEESFIKNNLPWLANAKIRASWGILGNDGIGQFLYERAYVGNQIVYDYGGKGQVQGWANFKVPNEEIKWEEVHQTDLGIDLGFLNNRLNVVYDYYNRQTQDMLYWRVVSMASGIGYCTDINTKMPVNIGKVENIGHELSITWTDHKAGWNYSVGFNTSFNRNKVIQLGEDGAAPLVYGINRTENGRAMGLLYGYKAIGIFSSQEQVNSYNAKAQAAGRDYYWKEKTGVGDLIYDDFGQGYVDEKCQTFIGNPWPKMYYGLNLNVEYKGFDLSMMFQGATGFEIYNGVKAYTQTFGDDGNTTKDIFQNSFFGDNGLTNMPRSGMFDENGLWIGDVSQNYSTTSSFWVEKGNYLKLKDLVIGYSLPQQLLNKFNINKLRVYFSANNLFTITKYSGIDPEIAGTSTSGNQSVLERGVDSYRRYLPSRLFAFGIDLIFNYDEYEKELYNELYPYSNTFFIRLF
ncbi:MAG: SusC/RagA family TonB-linked outer membrane protein [Bacteroides sp.]|nr:SusC/RagA family TonB-linked outer membrane protein [Bacteroides sp.]